MAERTAAQIGNNLSRYDKVDFVPKEKKNEMNILLNEKHTREEYNVSGYFIVDSSEVDGADPILDGASVYSALTPTTYVFNDNDTYTFLATKDLDLATNDWTWDYANGQITTTANAIVSDYIAKDSSAAWTSATVTVYNAPTDFTTDYSLKIIHDGGTTAASWSSHSFAASTSLKFQIEYALDPFSDAIFHLEQNGNNTDEKGYLTLTDTDVTYSTGKLGDAADFNNSTSKQSDTGTFTELDPSNDWSFCAWINKNADSRGTFLELHNSSSYLWIGYETTGLRVRVGYPFSQTDATSTFTNGQWHFVVVTYDASTTTLTLYVDNTEETVDNSITITSFTPTTVNIGNEDLQSFTRIMDGSIDQMVWFDSVIDSTKRAELYNSGSGVATFSGETLDMFRDTTKPMRIRIQYN